MNWIKRKVWLFRYAKEFKRIAGWSFKDSWDHGKSSLENIGNDYDECPIYMAEEDISCWSD